MTYTGPDALGFLHPKFRAQAQIDTLSPNSIVGIQFGDFYQDDELGLDHLGLILRSWKPAAYRGHGLWTHHSTDGWSRKLEKQLEDATAPVMKLAKLYFGPEWFWSPECEAKRDQKTMQRMVDCCHSIWPEARMVYSSLRSFSIRGALRETHGGHGGGQCNSLDGHSILRMGDSERKSWRASSNGAFRLWWMDEDNGRPNNSPPPPPDQRTHWATKRQMIEGQRRAHN